MPTISIPAHKDPTVALCLDTISRKKQALVFCSSKRAAESQAEKLAKSLKEDRLLELSKKILKVLANPTKQCKRLALCVRKGVAFHHAGLASKQRELIEDHFRKGDIVVICSTPTLAAGLDMPAFRAIIRDTKRFGQRGMQPIPVLEYEQMSGRAGRPGKEDFGEAIIVATKEEDIEYHFDRYVNGEVEDIFSKLAVEPVLRTYVLSLVSTGFIKNREELYNFFDTTFYAHQFSDAQRLHATLDRMIHLLQDWEFLEKEEGSKMKSQGFVTGSDLLEEETQDLIATDLGRRVSEIYIDPLSAHTLLEGLSHFDRVTGQEDLALAHLLCTTLELRPLLRVRAIDLEIVESMRQHKYLIDEDEYYGITHDDYDETLKTTQFFSDWMNEWSEDQLLEKYAIRPGEISIKLQIADWLLYAAEELARIKRMQPLIKHVKHARARIKHGVKSELMPLLQFKGIGRSRARKLFHHNIKKVSDVTQIPYETLSGIVGSKIAANLKEQVGEKVEVKPTTRASTLNDF